MRRARRRRILRASKRGWIGGCPGTPSPTALTPTLGWTSGTVTTSSSATAIRSTAPISSTAVATRRWAHSGIISTRRRLDARKFGKIRPTAIPRRRPTNGGTGTTITKPKSRSTRNGTRGRPPEKRRSAISKRARSHERDLDRRREPRLWRRAGRGRLAPARGPRRPFSHGGHDRLPRRRGAAALLSIGTWRAHERNGPDVLHDGRLPFGALAEADRWLEDLM